MERQVIGDDEKRIQTEQVRIKIFNEDGKAYAEAGFLTVRGEPSV